MQTCINECGTFNNDQLISFSQELDRRLQQKIITRYLMAIFPTGELIIHPLNNKKFLKEERIIIKQTTEHQLAHAKEIIKQTASKKALKRSSQDLQKNNNNKKEASFFMSPTLAT